MLRRDDPAQLPLATAIVVGGSLAGLTAALGLARAGYSVTVLERSGPAPRSGAAVGNAGESLNRLFSTSGLASDEAAAAVPRDVPAQTWEQVHRLLSAAAEADPGIRLFHRGHVVTVGQDETTAWASTEDGTIYRAEVLVGADGHRSIVRRTVAPDRPHATFAGYVNWLGIADESELDRGHGAPWPSGLAILDAGPYTLLGYPLAGESGSMAPGHRRLGWAWFDPNRNDVLRAAGCIDGAVVAHSMRPADLPRQLIDELDDEARAWRRPWREAIRACLRRGGVTGTPVAEYLPDRLAAGRIVLVGDAAHVCTPMTGRGFARALGDAEALTRTLARALDQRSSSAPIDVAGALAAYERDVLGPARELVLSGQSFSRSFVHPSNRRT